MVKVEVLVLLAAISIVAAVPTKSSKASRKLSDVQKKFVTDHMKYQSMLDKRDPKLADDYEKMKAINAATEAEKIDQLNVRSFRLPNNTIPLLYDIHIRTNVHSADFAFHGLTRINIRVLETSNTITMHSSRMLIQQINLLDAQGNMLERELPFTFDSVLEFITITTFPILEVDEELIVEIEYSGFLSNDGWGFYRTRYIDQELGTFWVATTLFEPTFARRAFPCFDEIRYRVPFDIRIVHHESYHALSNMPVATTARNGDFITTTFDTTPAMPTHNVAFTVSNFASISNNESDHRLMSVYAVPAAVAAGRADSALELGVTFLNVLEELFEIPFALPKSDQVAVDNWRNGEGWGLIKIDDWILLRNVVNDFRLRTRRISIAHEYSHSYFGNLVSPSDWSYLWLNEGFATLYENIINDIVFSEESLWEDFLVDFFDFVIDFDSFGFLDTLNMYVESPFAIRGKFDTTTYRKGAIVLKMLKDALSEKIFLNGIKIYLNEMQFKSVSPEDLYRALQQAYDEAFPGNDLKIEDLMQTWTNSKGLPIVTVSRSENGLLLTQDSLGTENNELFSIPINYATASNQNFDNFTAEIWMTTKEIEITRENAGKTWTDDDWIIFNLRDTGYYLTNYDETLWGLITTSLANDHEAVHYLNRGTLFADIHRFIEHAIDFRATILLEMIDSLKLEFHPHVWRRADMGLLVFQMRLRGSELHGMYLNFLQQTMNEIHGREFETLSGTWATETVNSLSCHSGVKACEDDALGALVEVMETGVTSFQFPFRCNGFRVANETVWMHFFNTALAIDDGNWNRMFQVYDLECTQNPEFIKFYLDTVLDMTNNLRMSERQEMIRIMARENNVGYNAIIELVEENPEFFNTDETNLSNLIMILASHTNTECQAERVLDLVRFIPEEVSDFFTREFFRSFMEANLRFFSRNSEEIRSWLENYENNKRIANN